MQQKYVCFNFIHRSHKSCVGVMFSLYLSPEPDFVQLFFFLKLDNFFAYIIKAPSHKAAD